MENDVFLPGFNAETISVFPKRDYGDAPFNSGIHFHDFTEIPIRISMMRNSAGMSRKQSNGPGKMV